MKVFEKFGVELPHYAAFQAEYGEEVSYDDLKPGDLVFYAKEDNYIFHVSIYMGHGKVVHAENSERDICISNVNFEPVACFRRLL